jgi:arginine utilization protein RocB
MRAAVPFLNQLAEENGLTWECLIDLEPGSREEGAQSVYIGSVGKLLPAVLVQGRKAHVVNCFQGINAVGVLGEYFRRTELAPEFSETLEGEKCPPPTWLYFRDRKEGYDVSVPDRAAGYMSVLGFEKTAQSLLERLKEIAADSFEAYYRRMDAQCNEMGEEALPHDFRVISCEELEEICRKRSGEEVFERWYEAQRQYAAEKIREGSWNYPQATIELMDALLTYSDLTEPAIVIAYAPPYYPPYHSKSSRYFEMLEEAASKTSGLSLKKKNYFCGISDLSYCGGPGSRSFSSFASNAPLCPEVYSVDENAWKTFWIPALLFGPLGKDIHQRSERVYAPGLFEEVPEALCKTIEQMFAK